jgi:hypothetical protein
MTSPSIFGIILRRVITLKMRQFITMPNENITTEFCNKNKIDKIDKIDITKEFCIKNKIDIDNNNLFERGTSQIYYNLPIIRLQELKELNEFKNKKTEK